MADTVKRPPLTAVAPRFQRSINLHDDWRNDEVSSGYIVTPNVAQSLKRLLQGVLTPKGQRSFALTGPYGSGKSAFAVFVSQLLGCAPSATKKAVSLLPPQLKSTLKNKKLRGSGTDEKGFLVIPITARRRPIAQLILEGIFTALTGLPKNNSTKSLQTRVSAMLLDEAWHDTSLIIKSLKGLLVETQHLGFTGILLVVDEAGKTLEYALQDRSGGDVYVFQEIAEFAGRQEGIPLLFLILLHQMFDDYVELSDRTLRNEWNKVQERFQTIQFAESAAATIRMVASAFKRHDKLPDYLTDEIDTALRQIQQGAMTLPLGIEFAEFKEMAYKAWPLHPSVLLAMPYLFRRLAQNERSIFSYLTSQEPFGLQDHLENPLGEDNFIRLHHLYSYFLANFEAGLARLPQAKRLLEANDIINSRQHLTSEQLTLIRTVAMFNVLSEICPLRATPNALACATSTTAIEEELQILKQQSILTFRRFDGSYRVWEGSDVDIEARMNEARRKLQLEGLSPLEALCRHVPRQVIVARRHGLETGIYRYFNLIYVESLRSPSLKKTHNDVDAAGTIAVLLPQADSKKLEATAYKETKQDQRLIIAMPRQIDALRGVVEEVACLKWVEQNTEELRDDRIARRELSLRLAMGEQHIAQLMQSLLDPRPAPVGNSCRWIWQGVDHGPKKPVDVTRLLSRACDAIFPQSPRLRNELVVRKKLSSAAAAARRVLLERMLNHEGEERLGIEGYPPERSIYESLLRATGIHALNAERGCWEFVPPPADNDRGLHPCWDMMEREVFGEGIRRIPLVDLFQQLADIPYGLPDGVHPVLFTAFYLCYQDELFLYRENTFVPDLEAAHLELLQRRPDLFAISGARITGTRRAVVERLARGLGQPPQTAAVVRALYRALNSLPPVTLRTRMIKDPVTLAMRDALLQASSPEELLFNQLPECFGLRPFKKDDERIDDLDRFFSGLNQSLDNLRAHAEELATEYRDLVLNECGLPAGDEGWHELERGVAWLLPRVRHEVLTPFLNAVHNGMTDNHNCRPALSLIANRPFDQWGDMDIHAFTGLAKGMGEIFRQIWQNYGEPGKIMSYTLTTAEEKQKETVRQFLADHVRKFSRKGSRRVVAVALRELLAELEQEE